MQEYRTGEHNLPFEEDFFDEMDCIIEENLHELYKAAAVRYPKFLNLLVDQNCTFEKIYLLLCMMGMFDQLMIR